MQNINFYDRSLRLRRDWLSAPMALAAMTAVAVIVAGVGGALQWRLHTLAATADTEAAALRDVQAALLSAARQVAAVRADPALEQRVLATQHTLEQHQSALRMLREGGSLGAAGYAPALEALARQSFDGLWLTGLTLDRADIALRGRSLRPELIPAYVERLRLEPALQGQAFRALDIRRPDLERDAGTSPPADAPKGAVARAPYVEFSLTGSSAATPGVRP